MLTPYADIPYADRYNADMGRSAWGGLSDAEKQAALNRATVAIDGGLYKGITPPDQEHKFPRNSPDAAVPDAVKCACCEEAYARACDEGASARHERAADGVTAEAVGSASRSYSGRIRAQNAGMALWSEEACAYLRPWMLGSAVIV